MERHCIIIYLEDIFYPEGTSSGKCLITWSVSTSGKVTGRTSQNGTFPLNLPFHYVLSEKWTFVWFEFGFYGFSSHQDKLFTGKKGGEKKKKTGRISSHQFKENGQLNECVEVRSRIFLTGGAIHPLKGCWDPPDAPDPEEPESNINRIANGGRARKRAGERHRRQPPLSTETKGRGRESGLAPIHTLFKYIMYTETKKRKKENPVDLRTESVLNILSS